ncbi:MAG: MBG domain-containing protein, partial [Planctomycetota bacterium]|nr:MBG domain-containing protein [Planctomycetota bacterium]
PSLLSTITGFVNGDTSSVVSGQPSLSTTATPTSLTGVYPISITANTLAASDYTFTLVSGSLTVTVSSSTEQQHRQQLVQGQQDALQQQVHDLTTNIDVLSQDLAGITADSKTVVNYTFAAPFNVDPSGMFQGTGWDYSSAHAIGVTSGSSNKIPYVGQQYHYWTGVYYTWRAALDFVLPVLPPDATPQSLTLTITGTSTWNATNAAGLTLSIVDCTQTGSDPNAFIMGSKVLGSISYADFVVGQNTITLSPDALKSVVNGRLKLGLRTSQDLNGEAPSTSGNNGYVFSLGDLANQSTAPMLSVNYTKLDTDPTGTAELQGRIADLKQRFETLMANSALLGGALQDQDATVTALQALDALELGGQAADDAATRTLQVPMDSVKAKLLAISRGDAQVSPITLDQPRIQDQLTALQSLLSDATTTAGHYQDQLTTLQSVLDAEHSRLADLLIATAREQASGIPIDEATVSNSAEQQHRQQLVQGEQDALQQQVHDLTTHIDALSQELVGITADSKTLVVNGTLAAPFNLDPSGMFQGSSWDFSSAHAISVTSGSSNKVPQVGQQYHYWTGIYYTWRAAMDFALPVLPPDATPQSLTLRITGTNKANAAGLTLSIVDCTQTGSDPNAFIMGSKVLGSISYTDFVVGQNTITLSPNAFKSVVNGRLKLGLRTSQDLNGEAPSTSGNNIYVFCLDDLNNPSTAPTLTVNYTKPDTDPARTTELQGRIADLKQRVETHMANSALLGAAIQDQDATVSALQTLDALELGGQAADDTAMRTLQVPMDSVQAKLLAISRGDRRVSPITLDQPRIQDQLTALQSLLSDATTTAGHYQDQLTTLQPILDVTALSPANLAIQKHDLSASIDALQAKLDVGATVPLQGQARTDAQQQLADINTQFAPIADRFQTLSLLNQSLLAEFVETQTLLASGADLLHRLDPLTQPWNLDGKFNRLLLLAERGSALTAAATELNTFVATLQAFDITTTGELLAKLQGLETNIQLAALKFSISIGEWEAINDQWNAQPWMLLSQTTLNQLQGIEAPKPLHFSVLQTGGPNVTVGFIGSPEGYSINIDQLEGLTCFGYRTVKAAADGEYQTVTLTLDAQNFSGTYAVRIRDARGNELDSIPLQWDQATLTLTLADQSRRFQPIANVIDDGTLSPQALFEAAQSRETAEQLPATASIAREQLLGGITSATEQSYVPDFNMNYSRIFGEMQNSDLLNLAAQVGFVFTLDRDRDSEKMWDAFLLAYPEFNKPNLPSNYIEARGLAWNSFIVQLYNYSQDVANQFAWMMDAVLCARRGINVDTQQYLRGIATKEWDLAHYSTCLGPSVSVGMANPDSQTLLQAAFAVLEQNADAFLAFRQSGSQQAAAKRVEFETFIAGTGSASPPNGAMSEGEARRYLRAATQAYQAAVARGESGATIASYGLNVLTTQTAYTAVQGGAIVYATPVEPTDFALKHNFDVVRASDGTGTPEERLADYVRANPEAMQYLPGLTLSEQEKTGIAFMTKYPGDTRVMEYLAPSVQDDVRAAVAKQTSPMARTQNRLQVETEKMTENALNLFGDDLARLSKNDDDTYTLTIASVDIVASTNGIHEAAPSVQNIKLTAEDMVSLLLVSLDPQTDEGSTVTALLESLSNIQKSAVLRAAKQFIEQYAAVHDAAMAAMNANNAGLKLPQTFGKQIIDCPTMTVTVEANVTLYDFPGGSDHPRYLTLTEVKDQLPGISATIDTLLGSATVDYSGKGLGVSVPYLGTSLNWKMSIEISIPDGATLTTERQPIIIPTSDGRLVLAGVEWKVSSMPKPESPSSNSSVNLMPSPALVKLSIAVGAVGAAAKLLIEYFSLGLLVAV